MRQVLGSTALVAACMHNALLVLLCYIHSLGLLLVTSVTLSQFDMVFAAL
jgi:hypothetical protein